MADTKISSMADGLLPTTADAWHIARSGADFQMKWSNVTKSLAGSVVNAFDYGVKADGVMLSDVTTTSGSAVISSASYTFTVGDVGKVIAIHKAGTSATTALNTNILSVSGGNATLSATAGQTIAGIAVAFFGTNDTTAIASANTAAQAKAVQGNGALIDLPSGIMMITGGFTIYSKVSWRGKGSGNTILKYANSANMGAGVFQGLSGSATSPYSDNHFTDFEIDCDAALQSTYSVTGKAFYCQFMVRPVVSRIVMRGTPATSVGIDYLVQATITENVIYNGGRLNTGTDPGGAGIGIGTGNSNIVVDSSGATQKESNYIAGNHIYQPKRYGIFFETQVAGLTQTDSIVVNNNILNGVGTLCAIGDAGCYRTLIANNHINSLSNSSGGFGIAINSGTLGTSVPGVQGLITGNVLNNLGSQGIILNYGTNANSSVPANYKISNNKISNIRSHGIQLLTSSTSANTLDTVDVSDNDISLCSLNGIYMSGTAAAKNLSIVGNKIYNNGQAGTTGSREAINIGVSVDQINIMSNWCYDNQATQTQGYALAIVAAKALTNVFMAQNKFTPNLVGVLNLNSTGTIGGIVKDNVGLTQTTTVTAAYTITGLYQTIDADATAGAFAVTLPSVTAFTGQTLNIKKVDSSANAVTIQAAGAELIDGSNTKVIGTQYLSVSLQSNGTGWDIL